MNFSAFYDDVLLDCARCPVPVALQAIRLAVRELCEKSRIWTHTTAAQPAVANQPSYTIVLPADTEVVSVLGGYYNDQWLEPESQDALDARFGRWQSRTGGPQYVTHDAPSVAIVVPYPDVVEATDAFRWRVALRPTLASTAFDPSSLFCNDFYSEILHGAKARLMASPDKPYTDLKLAEFHAKNWLAGINRARLSASRSRGRAEGVVAIPRVI